LVCCLLRLEVILCVQHIRCCSQEVQHVFERCDCLQHAVSMCCTSATSNASQNIGCYNSKQFYVCNTFDVAVKRCSTYSSVATVCNTLCLCAAPRQHQIRCTHRMLQLEVIPCVQHIRCCSQEVQHVFERCDCLQHAVFMCLLQHQMSHTHRM